MNVRRAGPLLWGVVGFVGSVWNGFAAEAVAHPAERGEEVGTVIWTPIFQAGWDAMNRRLGGVPTRSGSKLGKQLDEFVWKAEEVLPEGRWRVWAGPANSQFSTSVNREAAEFLGEAQGPFRPVVGERAGAVAFYSLLDATVSFELSFVRSRKVGMNFCDALGEESQVAFFGVQGEASGNFRRSVRVLSWRPRAGFMAVELTGVDDSSGSVILFQPPERQSFDRACGWIRVWRQQGDESPDGKFGQYDDRFFHDGDRLRVPYLRFEQSEDFAAALKGGRFYGLPGDPYEVIAARQRVSFTLHERGAKARVVAEGGMDPFASELVTVPRDFSFDRPFFVFLWKDGVEWPYFSAWIGDASCMEVFRGERDSP